MNRHRGGPWFLSLIIAAVVLWPSAPVRAANTTVIERGTQYVPAQVDVTVGDKVTWVYESSPTASQGHTVTFNDRDLNPNCPPTLLLNDCQNSASKSVSRTFSTPGNYAYFCKIHRDQGMTGVVVVSALSSTSSTTAPGSSTTATVKASTTTTTRAATSSTTSTTRALATSSTVMKSSTTTSDTSSALQPGEAPPFSDGSNPNAAGSSGGSKDGSDSGTVALIVVALLAVSAGGGYLLWRLRPGRA